MLSLPGEDAGAGGWCGRGRGIRVAGRAEGVAEIDSEGGGGLCGSGFALLIAQRLADGIGDVGEDGGAARRNAVLREQVDHADEEAGNVRRGMDFPELRGEINGELSRGCGGVVLCGVDGAVKGVGGGDGLATVASLGGDMAAGRERLIGADG